MRNNLIKYILIFVACMFLSCSDDDTFGLSTNNVLSFETDTISLDTCFSTIATPHKMCFVYNNSGDGIRISNVRLEHGNQTGFRVNVNGTYLGNSDGYQIRDLELRNKDSLRVFVELTSNLNGNIHPELVEDNLIFTLESGIKQKINLNAWSWDADIYDNYCISGDSTTVFSNKEGKPIVIYGTLTINKGSILEINPGSTVYFHSGANIDVQGCLKLKGEKDDEITFRCDRFDWMVSNLSYDNNPGQWGGVHIASDSYDNEVKYTNIHAGTTAFLCDSSFDNTRDKISIINSTIHNLKGYGIKAINSNIKIANTQISNTLEDCVCLLGGSIDINNCTIAQYFPFDARRGAALYFTNGKDGISYPLNLNVKNTIIKGYADDVITWSHGGTEDKIEASFDHCIVRTVPGDDYMYMFKDCIIEDNPKDTTTSARNTFVLFDTQNFFYDFTPKSGTTAIGSANPETSLPYDRKGHERSNTTPDIGCFETQKEISSNE